MPPMVHNKLQRHLSGGSREEDLNYFYHTWRSRQSISCDLNHLYKLLFPLIRDKPCTGKGVSDEETIKIVDRTGNVIVIWPKLTNDIDLLI